MTALPKRPFRYADAGVDVPAAEASLPKLRAIAERVAAQADCLAASLKGLGHRVQDGPRFDTVRVWPEEGAAAVIAAAAKQRINLRDYGDGSVGIIDFLTLLVTWGPCPGCPQDLDNDGVVGILDLLALLAAWGSCS